MPLPLRPLRNRFVPLLALCAIAAGFLVPMGGCGRETAASAPTPSTAVYDPDGRLLKPRETPLAKNAPNLVVLVIDTLRQDGVVAPTEQGGIMPFVTSLANEGVHMTNAVAPSSWTVPSITSFLTGLLPSAHGNDSPTQTPRLLGAVTTYAEILRESHGFETAAFTAGPWMNGGTSLLQGFTHGAHDFALQGTEAIVGSFAKKRDPSKPFFLLLHTFEAHDPYGAKNHPWPLRPVTPGPHSDIDPASVTEPWEVAKHFLLDLDARLDLIEHRGRDASRALMRYTWDGYRNDPRPDLAADLRAAYTAGVTWVDSLVEKAVAQLRAWGMLENTVLVVTSDHGEAFGEHGMLGHGRQLYDELIHIPLVMTGPAPFDGGRAIRGAVGLHDILPTFLDHIGGAPLPGAHGRSFLPQLQGEVGGRVVFSEERVTRGNTQADEDQIVTSARSERWKYILTYDRLEGTVLEEAYDLAADPGEQADLCAGSGRVTDLDFDAAFCEAIERVRDRIWGEARTSERLYASPYAGGRALVTSKRPPSCGR